MKNITFGRSQYLGILEKRVSALKDGYRQNIAILGDEMIGKTSLLLKFLKEFCDPRTLTIYLEIKPEPLDAFAKRFIGAMLYNFLGNSGCALKEDTDFLLNRSSGYIPKTIAKAREILKPLNKRKTNTLFTELLSLCDSIYQETDKHCVVIFDEFHNLQNLGAKNIYSDWSKQLILQKTTMYIITSSLKFKARAILSKSLSLLFGNFEVINVEPFEQKTSEEYLDYRLKGLPLEKGQRDFIIHFTAGIPLYLELLCDGLVKSKPGDITDILEGLLFTPAGILNQRFENHLKRLLELPNNVDYTSILYQVANGDNKLSGLAHILRKPKKEIQLRINTLLEYDYLSRSGDFYKLNDRVFGFWLKFVYQGRFKSLAFDQQNLNTAFRNNIKTMIQEFFLDSRKPLSERTAELLRVFEDEVMQLENKRLRLDRFHEIKPVEFGSKNIKQGLIGRSNSNLWIMGFKHTSLNEDDITEFSRECKKYRSKPQRKIIITTADIDANARLRALEEKILTWDLKNLNQILDLFCKPSVIV